jgi:hypothetical protein
MITTVAQNGHETSDDVILGDSESFFPNGDYDSVDQHDIVVAAITVAQEAVRHDLPNLDYCN